MKKFLILALFFGLFATGCYNRKLGNIVISRKSLDTVTSTTDSIKMTFFFTPQISRTHKLSRDSSASEQQFQLICENGDCTWEGVKAPHPNWLPPYRNFLKAIYSKSKTPIVILVNFK